LEKHCSVNDESVPVAHLHEWFEDESYVYIVLEAFDSDLRTALEDSSTKLETKLKLMAGAARAVAYMHSLKKSIQDLDLNFLVKQKENQVKIDFSLVEDFGTMFSRTVGNMPPSASIEEGFEANSSFDIYFLGSMLYKAIFGREIFAFAAESYSNEYNVRDRQETIQESSLKDVLRIPTDGNNEWGYIRNCKHVKWPEDFEGRIDAQLAIKDLIFACLEPKDDAERLRRVCELANRFSDKKDEPAEAEFEAATAFADVIDYAVKLKELQN